VTEPKTLPAAEAPLPIEPAALPAGDSPLPLEPVEFREKETVGAATSTHEPAAVPAEPGSTERTG
jgi:hypothetical protein